MTPAELVASWDAEDMANGWEMPPPERCGRGAVPWLPKLPSLPDPDERGMAFALAMCGPVEEQKVRALLVAGDESALTEADADRLHEWLSALLFANGDAEDDEQIALWIEALEGMS